MWDGGELYALPTPVPHTDAHGCSSSGLLPTPIAQATHRTHSGYGNVQLLGAVQGERDLRSSGALFPTPRATDGTNGGPNQRGSSGDLMLPSAVQQLLPTPTAQATHRTHSGHGNVQLLGAVQGERDLRSSGAGTNPPSAAGSASSDDQPPDLLSLLHEGPEND